MKTIFLEGINKDELTLEKPVVATIGFFDGVHLGHQFLINRLAEMAKQENLESMVITFDCHPRQVLQSNYQPRMLTTLEEKLEKLEKTASDHIVVLHFDKALAQLNSKQFMESILRERLNVRKLMMGYDNRFGHNRTETFDDYVLFGKEIGIEVCKNTALSMGNFNVSSSVIRQFIETGNMEEATRCLGIPYSLSGKIVGGYQNGRKLGYPTANIDIRKTNKLLPAMGVYAVQVRIENNEKIYGGMLNIGTRPTFNGSDLSVEVYIFDFSGTLYDRTIKVFFMSRVRSDRIFPTLEALAEQLQLDEQQIRTILKDQ